MQQGECEACRGSGSGRKAATLRQHYYPEGGWGWLVLCCALLLTASSGALSLAAGFFAAEVRENFGDSFILPVLVVSLQAAMSLLLSPLWAALVGRNGARGAAVLGGVGAALTTLFCSFASQPHQVLLAQGLLGGVSEGLARDASHALLGRYFKRRRPLVEGMFLVGHGLALATVPLLATHWIKQIGWRHGLQILAATQCVISSVVVLYRPAALYHPQRRAILHIKSLQKRSKDRSRVQGEKKPFWDFSVLKSRTVQVLITGATITALGIASPVVLLVEEMQKDQLDLRSMYQIQLYLGLSVSTGAAVSAFIVIHNILPKQYLCQAASFLLSGWLLAYPYLTGFYGYLLFVCLYGFLYGSYIYALKLSVFEKVRARNFATAWSFLQGSQAIPTFIGLPFIYYLNDQLGSKHGYCVCSAVLFVGGASLFLIRRKRQEARPPCVSEEALVGLEDFITSCHREVLMLSEQGVEQQPQ